MVDSGKDSVRITIRFAPKNYEKLKKESKDQLIPINGLVNRILARYYGIAEERLTSQSLKAGK